MITWYELNSICFLRIRFQHAASRWQSWKIRVKGNFALHVVLDDVARARSLYLPSFHVFETSNLILLTVSSLKDENFGEKYQKYNIFRDVVCQWLLVHWNDFEEDDGYLEKRLVALLDELAADDNLESVVSKVHVFLSTARQYRSGPSLAPADSILPSILPKNMPCPLRKVHPEELARQITILQWQVFWKLNLSRAIPFQPPNTASNNNSSQNSASSSSSGKVTVMEDYVSATPWTPFGDWNNLGGHLQRWAATNVCTVPKPSARTKMLHFMIELAYFLFKLSNYDGCYRILEGLKLIALPNTWSNLSSKIRNVHDNLTNAVRQLFTDVTRITNAAYPHIPIVESFTNSLQQIGLRQPRFRDPIGNGPKRWIETSASSNALRVAANNKTQDKKSSGRRGSTSLTESSPGKLTSTPSSDTPNDPSEMRLNMTRAHAEALLLSRLRSFQSKPFPFAPVSWIADFVSHANPLSIWTIQEYCETLEPTKYHQPVLTRRNTSSPRHIGKNAASASASVSGFEISPPPSPRPESPDSSPRGYVIHFSPQTTDWVDYESMPNSPNSSPPKPSEVAASSSSASPHSNSNFNHRRPLQRQPTSFELELERLGFYVFSSPPIADLPLSESTSKHAPKPNWWALLDEDRLSENEEDVLLQILLEYLPLPSYDSLFTLSPIKAACLNMKSHKITNKLKEASRLKFRRDFCFAAPAHAKRVKPNSYRFVNLDAPRHMPVTHTLTLTNTSNTTVEFEFGASAPLLPSPHITKGEVFVAFSPASGNIGPGKSVSIKVTVVLLEEAQFYKIFKVQTFWPDLGYACFIPIFIAQACASHAPTPDMIKEMTAATAGIASPAALDDIKKKMSIKFPKPSADLSRFDNEGFGSSKSPTTLSSSVPNSSFLASSMASYQASQPAPTFGSSASSSSSIYLNFWKIPYEDLKMKRRLGGTQAAVSLCSLYGADVVLKKWDIGSLDPVPPEFVLEFEALRTLRHPNLVQFIGAQATQGVAFVVTEYVQKGTLQDLFQSGELRKRGGGAAALRTSSPRSAQSTSVSLSASASGSATVSPYSTLSTTPNSTMAAHGSNGTSPNANYNPFIPNESPRNLASSTSGSESYSNPPQIPTLRKSVPSSSSAQSAGQSTGWASGTVASQGTALPALHAICRVKLGIATDIASAMAYMHYNSRMHRDLKSLNILIDECFRAKIADLGSSKSWTYTQQMTSGVGSYDWIAPEVVASRAYSAAADVFSYGLVLWEIVHEQFPDRPMDMVARGGIPPIDPERFIQMFPDPDSPSAVEFEKLILKCCDADPSQRPSFADVLILLEQILTSPLAWSPRRGHSRAPSSGGNVSPTSGDAIGDVRRTPSSGTPSQTPSGNISSGDLWIRAMKSTSTSLRTSATAMQSPYVSSIPSSPSTPHALGSPIASSSGLSSDETASPNASPPRQDDSFISW